MTISSDKKEIAVQMRLEGKTYQEIADHIGCSDGWCALHLKGILKRKERAAGTYEKIAGYGHGTRLNGVWNLMVQRCTSEKAKKRHPTYVHATIAEEFLNFRTFIDWCERQVGCDEPEYHLDKDILVRGNKHYGPDTCAFVPREVNSFLTLRNKLRGDLPIGVCWKPRKSGNGGRYQASMSNGTACCKWLGEFDTVDEAFQAYKEAKEAKAKELAEKYRGKMDERVCEALYAYRVNIKD